MVDALRLVSGGLFTMSVCCIGKTLSVALYGFLQCWNLHCRCCLAFGVGLECRYGIFLMLASVRVCLGT